MSDDRWLKTRRGRRYSRTYRKFIKAMNAFGLGPDPSTRRPWRERGRALNDLREELAWIEDEYDHDD